jgi:hypothetical protein
MSPIAKKSTDSYDLSIIDKAQISLFKGINQFVPWHKLPSYIGAFNLDAFRKELRKNNLHDTYPSPSYQGIPGHPPIDDDYLYTRNSDGLFNALDAPKMGCTGMRLGRNVPRQYTKKPTEEEMLTPNPRLISRELLARTEFKPATILNLLAAAWIQFQVHDWFQHTDSTTQKISVPVPEGDTWPGGKVEILATKADEPLDEMDRDFPAYKNEDTHWWVRSVVP